MSPSRKPIEYEKSEQWTMVILFHQPKRILTRTFGPFPDRKGAQRALRAVRTELKKDDYLGEVEKSRITVHINQLWVPQETRVIPRTVAEKKAFEEAFDARIAKDKEREKP